MGTIGALVELLTVVRINHNPSVVVLIDVLKWPKDRVVFSTEDRVVCILVRNRSKMFVVEPNAVEALVARCVFKGELLLLSVEINVGVAPASRNFRKPLYDESCAFE